MEFTDAVLEYIPITDMALHAVRSACHTYLNDEKGDYRRGI